MTPTDDVNAPANVKKFVIPFDRGNMSDEDVRTFKMKSVDIFNEMYGVGLWEWIEATDLPSEHIAETGASLEDVVNGTPAGQAAVQKAVEDSAKVMAAPLIQGIDEALALIKVKVLREPEPYNPATDNLFVTQERNGHIDHLVIDISAARTAIQKLVESSYLNHFEYMDWEIGDDNKLRVGDYINCNHQRPHDGYERNFEGQIVLSHANKLPVIIYNVDPKDPDDSGEYADINTLFMEGWEFSRLSARLSSKEQS